MGILDKLFGDEESQETDDKDAELKKLIPRSERVRLLPLHKIEFNQKSPNVANGIQLSNLSISGAGFIRNSAASWPAHGSVLCGSLNVDGKTVPVALKIVHNSPAIVGCAFEGETTELERTIDQFFKVELAAIKMEVLQTKPVKGIASGKAFWFRGPHNCELYFVEDPSGVVLFHLSVFGNYIESGESGVLSFGTVVSDGDASEMAPLSSNNIKKQTSVPNETLEAAMKFIENVSSINPNQRSAICSSLDRARK